MVQPIERQMQRGTPIEEMSKKAAEKDVEVGRESVTSTTTQKTEETTPSPLSLSTASSASPSHHHDTLLQELEEEIIAADYDAPLSTSSRCRGDNTNDILEEFSCSMDADGHVDIKAHLSGGRDEIRQGRSDTQDSFPSNVVLSTSPLNGVDHLGIPTGSDPSHTDISNPYSATNLTGCEKKDFAASSYFIFRNSKKRRTLPISRRKTNTADHSSLDGSTHSHASTGTMHSILRNGSGANSKSSGDDDMSISHRSHDRSVHFENESESHHQPPNYYGSDCESDIDYDDPSRYGNRTCTSASSSLGDLSRQSLSRQDSAKRFDKYGASKRRRSRIKAIQNDQIDNHHHHNNNNNNNNNTYPLEIVSRTKSMSQRVDHAAQNCFSKLFGASYSKREGCVVLIAGAIMSFNTGFVNGATLSGFLTPTRTESIAAYTTPYSLSALAAAQGDLDNFRYYTCFVASYLTGSFISGLLTPNGTPFQIEPTYGPTFLIAGILLLVASILAALESNPDYIFFLAAAANGIQNGIASIYSANLIRCSLTGASTDAAIVVAQCLRGNTKQKWKGLVLFGIIISFWCGGLLSFYAARRFLTYTLFFNACLFWAIGIGIIFFLVHQLEISFRAAISGNWQWKQAIGSLHASMSSHYCNARGESSMDFSLEDVFDVIDDDGNGEIEPEELLGALLNAGVKISAKSVMVLIKSADSNGDGTINRSEWLKMVKQIKSQNMGFAEQIEEKRSEALAASSGKSVLPTNVQTLDTPSFHG